MAEKEITFDNKVSRSMLRQVLKLIGQKNLVDLDRHPMAQLEMVSAHKSSKVKPHTKPGAVLQDVVLQALESLKPADADKPNPTDKRWRDYLILTEQYLKQKQRDAIADWMCIDIDTYAHSQAEAVNRLAARLGENGVLERPETEITRNRGNAPFLMPPKSLHRVVGREKLLREVKQQLLARDTVAVTALNGLPGVGKTTLAIEVANDAEIIRSFTDGILWAGLGREPDVLGLLGRWGQALGFSDDMLSRFTSIESRAQAIHSTIGLRQMLLVVDDAWSSEAALSLRVGGANCAYLVTTRSPKIAYDAGLTHVTTVPELTDEDSMTLLSELAPKAVAAKPQEIQGLIHRVGGLPLALTLVGKHLGRHSLSISERRLAQLMSQLTEARTRLHLSQVESPLELRTGFKPGQQSLADVIEMSDANLSDAIKRTLYCLSIFPPKPNTFSEDAALQITQSDVEDLDTLIDSGLLEVVDNRYTLHQTIADYARERTDYNLVRQRMIAYYIEFVSTHSNFEAIDEEIQNILAAVELGLNGQPNVDAVRLVNEISDYMMTRGQSVTIENLLAAANEIGQQMKDDRLQALIMLNLCRSRTKLGKTDEIPKLLDRAYQLAEQNLDQRLMGLLLTQMGLIDSRDGNGEAAIAKFQRSIEIAKTCNRHDEVAESSYFMAVTMLRLGRLVEAEAELQNLRKTISLQNLRPSRSAAMLYALGVLVDRRGDHNEAERLWLEGLAFAESAQDLLRQTLILGNLGEYYHTFGENLALASQYLIRSVEIANRIQNAEAQAFALAYSAKLSVKEKNFDEAERQFSGSISICERSKFMPTLGHILGEYGEVLVAMNNVLKAQNIFLRQWQVSRGTREKDQIAQSLLGLAQVALHYNRKPRAHTLARRSQRIFDSIEHWRSKEVAEWIQTSHLQSNETTSEA